MGGCRENETRKDIRFIISPIPQAAIKKKKKKKEEDHYLQTKEKDLIVSFCRDKSYSMSNRFTEQEE